MASIRDQILISLVSLIEADPGVFDNTATVPTVVHRVYIEGENPVLADANFIELHYPLDEAVHDAREVAKTDDSDIPLDIILTFRQALSENNERIYNVIERLREIMWANPTLSLDTAAEGRVRFAHIEREIMRINPDEQTIMDGAVLRLNVNVRRNYN